MASSFEERYSDHLHEIVYNNDSEKLERVGQFDFESVYYNVDGEGLKDDPVSFSDMSAAFSLILSWACGRTGKHEQAPSIIGAGWRVHALLYLLDNGNARYGSLQEIADAAGVTRAAVSKALADLRGELGGILPFKRGYSSEVYSRAQHAAVAAGCHASQVRKQKREAAKS
jgi:hypothetical protein